VYSWFVWIKNKKLLQHILNLQENIWTHNLHRSSTKLLDGSTNTFRSVRSSDANRAGRNNSNFCLVFSSLYISSAILTAYSILFRLASLVTRHVASLSSRGMTPRSRHSLVASRSLWGSYYIRVIQGLARRHHIQFLPHRDAWDNVLCSTGKETFFFTDSSRPNRHRWVAQKYKVGVPRIWFGNNFL